MEEGYSHPQHEENIRAIPLKISRNSLSKKGYGFASI